MPGFLVLRTPHSAFGGDPIGVGVGIGIGIEGDGMSFGHERLDVYRVAVESLREERSEHAAGGIDPDTDSDPEEDFDAEAVPNKLLHQTGATPLERGAQGQPGRVDFLDVFSVKKTGPNIALHWTRRKKRASEIRRSRMTP